MTRQKSGEKKIIKRKKKSPSDSAKQIRGHKAVIKGLTFEKKIGEYLSKKDYKISYEKPIGKDRFDVFGYKDDPWEGREYCIVECKNKNRVTSADVLRFMTKLNKFKKSHEETSVQAILAYTGELPKDAQDATKGLKPSIKFKKF